MSATLGIIQQIKNLVNIMKKKDQKNQQTSTANRALIDRLLEMQKAYNQNTLTQPKDYSQPAPLPSSKSEAQLKEEASQYVSDLVEQNRQKIEAKTTEKISKLEDKQLKALRKYTDSQDKSQKKHQTQEEYITARTIKQGLTHSSIRDDWQLKNTQDYLSTMEIIRRDYDDQIAQIETQINIINTAKLQALADYDLTLSATYEKKLQQLRSEQINAIERVNAYNRDYERQLEQFRLEELAREMKEGYSGEKAVEMQNRYEQALSFYKSLDRSKALKLIEENKSDLKQTLGWYYMQLVNEIKRK